MTIVHAVIFHNDTHAWISVADWGNGDPAGIAQLTGNTMPELQELRAFAEAELQTTGLRFFPTGGANGVPFDPMNPWVAVFRFGGADWVARGFRPWGTATGDGQGGFQLRLVASADGGEEARWAKALAAVLYHIRDQAGIASPANAAALEAANMASTDTCVIFATFDDTADEVHGAGADAADFGNAADSDV